MNELNENSKSDLLFVNVNAILSYCLKKTK